MFVFSKKILTQLLVCFSGVSAAEQDGIVRKSVKEGESVTLDPGEIKNTNYTMKLYFNDTLIAEITGEQSEICTDHHHQGYNCTERFRDRLQLDNQTGSLIITNTRTTDSGDYELKIIISDSSFCINRVKRFSVSVTGEYNK